MEVEIEFFFFFFLLIYLGCCKFFIGLDKTQSSFQLSVTRLVEFGATRVFFDWLFVKSEIHLMR